MSFNGLFDDNAPGAPPQETPNPYELEPPDHTPTAIWHVKTSEPAQRNNDALPTKTLVSKIVAIAIPVTGLTILASIVLWAYSSVGGLYAN